MEDELEVFTNPPNDIRQDPRRRFCIAIRAIRWYQETSTGQNENSPENIVCVNLECSPYIFYRADRRTSTSPPYCRITYEQKISELAECPTVSAHFLNFVRERFKTYNQHTPTIYSGNLKKWNEEKSKFSDCDVEAMTNTLTALTPKTLDVGE